MQGRNKVLKGLGDRLTEEENEEVKCRQCVLAIPRLWASRPSMWRGLLLEATGTATGHIVCLSLLKKQAHSDLS